MNIVNLKEWFSTQQIMDLCGFKYRMQVIRWRRLNHIVWAKLCRNVFYQRESVIMWRLQDPDMYDHKLVLDNQYSVRYNYEKFNALQLRLAQMDRYDLDLSEWQPYCMLDPAPDLMVLSRLTDQLILPQIRYRMAHGIKFYNVQDVRRIYET